MDIRIKDDIAIVHSDTPIIIDAQSALDLTATLFYEYDVTKIALNKEALSEDFFKLSTGLAGEITQKFVNYHVVAAIIGDFSSYTSKPLQDYIYECNKGRQLFFVGSEQEALERLS